ncbi:Fructose-26-bisphosphatase [Rubrobacter radiotolerans]|uniref:Fructose-26-bisphosphatase n=1 Tax=Rubrobacter radiotolerans TaxID=42256 RepID=A0A023X2S8_RUBRA|nr:histidine phosphatase family protein [Rubrobacter radiotolerans]AHY46511.1 Fructose-26-bisphosphatase [Rubrobacter radiotolerans]MDX5893918.1 histidine phosphatase family protein [Rubrobacter radiotolerans]
MRELIIIRHGQSTANADGIWQGQLDYPLSELGREQARFAGEALANERLDAFYASPLSRAFETAEIIAEAAGYRGEIFAVPALTERSGGLFEGNTWAEREQTMPDVVAKFREVGEERGWSLIGAETDEEILARFAPAIEEILASELSGERAVVVSHGGVMRAFLRQKFGPDVLSGTERAPNASITRIQRNGTGSLSLFELASTGHIPPRFEEGRAAARTGEPASE